MKSVHIRRCYEYDQRGAYVLLETNAYVTLKGRNGSSVCGLLKVGVVEKLPVLCGC